ncbi:MAG: MATE family efflux transporter [Clostridia bacterium]|nr:MATE family efflux transporter [Clostridia bacterium]
MFAIPIMLTGILQLLFNAADMIVVGNFAHGGNDQVGAVGSCSALINLIVNTAMGLSIGVGVSVAHDIGSGDRDRLHRVIHTAISFSAILGVVVAVLGFFLAEPMLKLMATDPKLLNSAVAYMRAYFIGIPACMVYNYAAAAIRSAGDTVRPLIFLSVSGVVNVILNLIFVIGFGMGAEGVGLATAISQYVSMGMVLIYMLKTDKVFKIELGSLAPQHSAVIRILRVGLPSGLSSMLFAVSNVLIQSTVNSYGTAVVSGNAAGGTIDSFVYTILYSVSQTAIVFAGQNMGAGKYRRLDKIVLCSVSIVAIVGISSSSLVMLFSRQLLSIVTPGDPAVLDAGMRRLWVICAPYFLCGFMDTMASINKGMGKQIIPTLIVLIGTCVARVVWIFTVCRAFPGSPETPDNIYWLYLSYPVTWALAFLGNLIYYKIVMRKYTPKTV